MNKKYVFEYVGGTKGDLVVRFLNEIEPDISFDRANKTEPALLSCPNWLKLTNQTKNLTLERFEEVLSVNQYEYLPCHPLWVCKPTTRTGSKNLSYQKYMDLLKKYNYEIISLKYEPKHYVTIYIERVLKNDYKNYITHGNDGVRILNAENSKPVSLSDLDGGPAEIFARFESSPWGKKFNELTNDRTLLHYEELFCSNLPYPLHPHREDEWLMLVEQSWCNYDENDYRKFEIPEGWEKLSRLFSNGRVV
mgnify:CR=1 FL=1